MDIREGHSRKQEQPMQRPQGKPFSFPGTSSSLLLLNNRCLCICLKSRKVEIPIHHWSLGPVCISQGSSKGRSAWGDRQEPGSERQLGQSSPLPTVQPSGHLASGVALSL